MTAVLQQIAAIATGLTKAELHILLQLAARADSTNEIVAMASSRDLAEATDLARASVQTAIDSLNEKRLITSSAGSATQPAVHRLDCLEAVENKRSGLTIEPLVAQNLGQGGSKSRPGVDQNLSHSGLTAGPVVAQILSQGGPKTEPEVAQNLGQGGLKTGPPFDAKSSTSQQPHIERAITHADSIDLEIDKTIDRLQTAKKSDYDPELFERARNQIASHHAKFAREQNRQPGLPDDAITARFLSVAEWPRLESLLCDLASERKEAGHSYAWYVTVALQRLQGISPNKWRAAHNRTNQKPDHSIQQNVATVTAPKLLRAPSPPPQLAVDLTSLRVVRRSAHFQDLQDQVRRIASLRQL